MQKIKDAALVIIICIILFPVIGLPLLLFGGLALLFGIFDEK